MLEVTAKLVMEAFRPYGCEHGGAFRVRTLIMVADNLACAEDRLLLETFSLSINCPRSDQPYTDAFRGVQHYSKISEK